MTTNDRASEFLNMNLVKSQNYEEVMLMNPDMFERFKSIIDAHRKSSKASPDHNETAQDTFQSGAGKSRSQRTEKLQGIPAFGTPQEEEERSRVILNELIQMELQTGDTDLLRLFKLKEATRRTIYLHMMQNAPLPEGKSLAQLALEMRFHEKSL